MENAHQIPTEEKGEKGGRRKRNKEEGNGATQSAGREEGGRQPGEHILFP